MHTIGTLRPIQIPRATVADSGTANKWANGGEGRHRLHCLARALMKCHLIGSLQPLVEGARRNVTEEEHGKFAGVNGRCATGGLNQRSRSKGMEWRSLRNVVAGTHRRHYLKASCKC